MTRAWNFSAGPAAIPAEVLRQAQAEFLNWHGIGAGIMEVSHRGKAFMSVIETAEADLRGLLAIPDDYQVLFLQGGASLQFTQMPLNLSAGRRGDFLVTGAWSQKACKEASKTSPTRITATTKQENGIFSRLPDIKRLEFDKNAAYLHFCTNETIHGVEFHEESETCLSDTLSRSAPDVPLVADMSSNILSRPLDIRRYGLIYAGAQKNIGPAGLTLVIIRADLLERAGENVPGQLSYRKLRENGSMLNTPPSFSIYMAGLVFKWLKAQGGLEAIAAINREKARRLYEAIDKSNGFYRNAVDADCRSVMNIPFRLPSPELEDLFVKKSEAAGFIGLKGHKSIGGLRASLYNAVSLEAADALVLFMEEFAARRGQ